MKRSLCFLSVLIFGLVFSTMAAGHSYDLNRQQVVTLAALIGDLTQTQTVFIGETHDQQAHHNAQLQIIQELHE